MVGGCFSELMKACQYAGGFVFSKISEKKYCKFEKKMRYG